MNKFTKLLNTLKLESKGSYENQFYIINLKDSDEYAKTYTQLEETAVNTEYPSFQSNTNKTLTKTISYFEITVDEISYNLFLIADFAEDKYYLKIGEK